MEFNKLRATVPFPQSIKRPLAIHSFCNKRSEVIMTVLNKVFNFLRHFNFTQSNMLFNLHFVYIRDHKHMASRKRGLTEIKAYLNRWCDLILGVQESCLNKFYIIEQGGEEGQKNGENTRTVFKCLRSVTVSLKNFPFFPYLRTVMYSKVNSCFY